MPLKSPAQQRLMYATAGGADTGVPKTVAKEYISSTPRKKRKRLAKQQRRGM